MARLGRLYVAPAGGTTLTDVGVARFAEPVREESITTDPDTFGRRAELAYEAVVTVQFLQVDDQDLFDSLASPDQPVRIFIAPGPGYGSTVDWYTAVSDPDGYTLDNVYPVPSVNLDLGGGQSLITYTFRKRRKTRLISDGIEAQALFFHDWYGIANSPIRQELARIPIVGSVGTFTRNTTRPYFDGNGNYRIASVNELIFTKSPSGLLLPMISPAATNSVINNSTYSPGLVEVTLGNSVSWGGDGVTFTLKERVPSTASGAHTTIRAISGAATGDVWCYTFIYKPLKGQTKACVRFRLVGGSTNPLSGRFDINLNGSSTLPSEDTWFKPLNAGAVSIANGYYYCYASVYIKNKGDHTTVEAHHRVLDSSNNEVFVGDGTAYDIVGADGLYKNIIYPPAPIRTTGSTVTVAQDVLSFPFSTPFPSEGLTAHFEAELSVLSSELPPNDGQNWHFYNLGTPNTAAGGTYSPFGATVSTIRGELQLDNTVATGPQPVSSSYWRESVQLTLSGETYWRNGAQYSTRTQSRPAGMNPSPASIDISVARYAPIWLQRYALVKGIVDPKVVLT